MVIGIFGKSGSGKSTLCKYLEEKGFCIIDGDKIGHTILKKGNKGYSAVIEAFGCEFLTENKEIDRKRLGEYVFKNNMGDLLSKITHPIITEHIAEKIKEAELKKLNVAVDAALLCNTPVKDICDVLILIKSENCKERITKRDGITDDMAESRLRNQNISENADFIIENSGTIEELYEKTDEILKGLNI